MTKKVNPMDFFRWLARMLIMPFVAFDQATRGFTEAVKDLLDKDWEITFFGKSPYDLTFGALGDMLFADNGKDRIEGTLILMAGSLWTSLLGPWVTAGVILALMPFLFLGIFQTTDVGGKVVDGATSKVPSSLPGRGGDGSYSTRSGRK